MKLINNINDLLGIYCLLGDNLWVTIMKKYILASIFLMCISARAQDLSSILFLENPLLSQFATEQRAHMLRHREALKTGNPFLVEKASKSLDEFNRGLKKRISFIKNFPCKIARIDTPDYRSAGDVVKVHCAQISVFLFEAGIRESEAPLESLRVGGVMYISTPIDKIEHYDFDSIMPGFSNDRFHIKVQGAILNYKRGPISQARWRKMALDKCENFKTIEQNLRAMGVINGDGPKCEDLTGRFPDFSEVLKPSPISSLVEREVINKTHQESSNPPTVGYAALVRTKIKPNLIVNEYIDGNPVVEVLVRTSVDGTIVSQYVTKSSGNKVWDDAALNAVIRSRTLPRDVDGRIPSPIII